MVQAVTVRRLGMIAGGTGLTPMLQVVKRVLSRKEDTTQLSLIFANQTEAVTQYRYITLSYQWPWYDAHHLMVYVCNRIFYYVVN